MLSISGERKAPEGGPQRRERRFGKFYRAFRLPRTLDLDKIEAKMERGVLSIGMPKREEAKPKQINVAIN